MEQACCLLTFMSLTSVPRFLLPAERDGGLRYYSRICTDHANLESLCYSPNPANITREEISCEAVFRLVRQCDDLFFRIELGQSGDWSEGLFAMQQRVVWDVC